MTTLLTSHLEQISLCATSIAELPFPGPKIFTNALLSPHHDITALIRDTEQHERALFHLAPPSSNTASATADPSALSSATSIPTGGRRATRYEARQPRNRAIAAVLGGDLYQQTRKVDRQKGDVDVDALLRGAEKLVAVYPIPGAAERIVQLRRRYQQLAANIAHYETRVSQQIKELQLMNRPTDGSTTSVEENIEIADDNIEIATVTLPNTKQDLAREEEDIRDLERKKHDLEERVEGMERDLGGLLR